MLYEVSIELFCIQFDVESSNKYWNPSLKQIYDIRFKHTEKGSTLEKVCMYKHLVHQKDILSKNWRCFLVSVLPQTVIISNAVVEVSKDNKIK